MMSLPGSSRLLLPNTWCFDMLSFKGMRFPICVGERCRRLTGTDGSAR
jgi:hypothetical protein